MFVEKKGLLLSFVYKFGRVVHWCCEIPLSDATLAQLAAP
jgi:hypothetical protein